MLPPPSASGTIRVELGELNALTHRIEKALLNVQARGLRVTSGKITFRGGMLRGVPNWNILFPISYGEIRFTRSNEAVLISYRISLLGLFIIATAMVVAIGIWRPFSGDLFLLPLVWLFLFGGNYLIAVTRFPRFLARAVNGHPKGSNDQPIGSRFADY